MKTKIRNVQLVHEGEDYILVSYNRGEKIYESEITGGIAIEVIKCLAEALQKDSFIKKSK